MKKVYTKAEDKGTTSDFKGRCIAKDGVITEVNGTIDELSSCLGYFRSWMSVERLRGDVEWIQLRLAEAGAQISSEDDLKYITTYHVHYLEEMIDALHEPLKPISNFIIPGGDNVEGPYLHVCRTICRRLERRLVTLSKEDRVDEELMIFFNRLSDALYSMARFAHHHFDDKEQLWKTNSPS